MPIIVQRKHADHKVVQLARGAQSLKQIAQLYTDGATNARIVEDYVTLARQCTNQIEVAVNDDAIVAVIHLLNNEKIDVGLNFTNEMTKRWFLLSAIPLWACTFKVTPYCYALQSCDAGGLDIYTPPSKNHNHWKMQIDDAGRWGRGKDRTFQEVVCCSTCMPGTVCQTRTRTRRTLPFPASRISTRPPRCRSRGRPGSR
jgi:hypothetical protein